MRVLAGLRAPAAYSNYNEVRYHKTNIDLRAHLYFCRHTNSLLHISAIKPYSHSLFFSFFYLSFFVVFFYPKNSRERRMTSTYSITFNTLLTPTNRWPHPYNESAYSTIYVRSALSIKVITSLIQEESRTRLRFQITSASNNSREIFRLCTCIIFSWVQEWVREKMYS